MLNINIDIPHFILDIFPVDFYSNFTREILLGALYVYSSNKKRKWEKKTT